jgi:hypothetical protein
LSARLLSAQRETLQMLLLVAMPSLPLLLQLGRQSQQRQGLPCRSASFLLGTGLLGCSLLLRHRKASVASSTSA